MPTHPLEPLSAHEITEAVRILRASGCVGDDARFASVTLHEPPKDAVLAFQPGDALDREAEVVAVDRATGESFRGLVSVTKGEVRAWDRLDGHAMLLFEEMIDAIDLVQADPRWQAALRRRGVDDTQAVQCDPWPAGNFGLPEEEGRRVVRVLSYVRHGEGDNGYAHPIEGVVATVDTVRREVLSVTDPDPAVAPPSRCGNYDADSVGALRPDLRPVEITQPQGPSFEIEGHEVRWQKWRFRVSMHPTDGLVLHTVSYEDGGRLRPVLYRASLAEMVVPYGSPDPAHRWKNAFDSGELGLGRYPLLNSLVLGCDCVGAVRYLDVVQATEQGETQLVENAICIHEEDFGLVWKHFDLQTFRGEVRRQRRLVVSSIHTVGNYEYGFYWYFYVDGTLELEVKLTGILQTQGTVDGEVPEGAVLVSDRLAAPYHQHLFCFRLDLDVDGTANSVYEVELEPAPVGPANPLPYANALVSRETLLARESEARRVVDAARGRHWRIVNRGVRNAAGRPVGFRLLPGPTPTLLAPPGSRIAERAGFARHNLWVTPYDPAELRAAGYPNLSPGGDGLPRYAAADRSLEDTDVVVWYTFGVNHVPRPEDWPVMPVERAGFVLQPFGFFDHNPALDVPPPHAI